MQISLIVPIRDEAASLTRLLDSIRAQTRPPEEVVLVDGGSTDETAELARRLIDADPRIRVVLAGPATPGRGRNVGIAAARNDWIALTDAGIRLEPTWLERLIDVARARPEVGVIYGNYEPVTETFFERCAALAYSPAKHRRPEGPIRGPSIASCLLRRSAWSAAGGFPDLRAAEDLIFMRRIEEAGVQAGWAPTATVWWELRPGLASTFQKFVTYSRVNALAGQQRYWHYGIARKYLLAVPFIALFLLHSRWWLLLPLLGAVARVFKSVWVRREGRGLAWSLHPGRLAGVGAILLVIDLATFVGWAQTIGWRRGPTGKPGPTANLGAGPTPPHPAIVQIPK